MGNTSYVQYPDADQVLMDCIADMTNVVENSKLKHGNTENSKFWERQIERVKYGYGAIKGFAHYIEKIQFLVIENNWLRKQYIYERDRNLYLEVVLKLKLTDQFDSTVKMVDELLTIGLKNLERPENG